MDSQIIAGKKHWSRIVWHWARSLLFLTVGLLIITAIGAAIFLKVEGGKWVAEQAKKSTDNADLLNKLYDIKTKKMSRTVWLQKSEKELELWIEKSKNDTQIHHTFATSFMYCFTLYTTVGYGNVYPSTGAGKIFSVIYAILTIPYCLVYLSCVATLIESWLKQVLFHYKRFFIQIPILSQYMFSDDDYMNVNIPLTIIFFLLVVYTSIGIVFYVFIKGWSVLTAVYFFWVTFTTIGLGDYYPDSANIVFTMCSVLYLTIGIAIATIVINSLNDSISAILHINTAISDIASASESYSKIYQEKFE